MRHQDRPGHPGTSEPTPHPADVSAARAGGRHRKRGGAGRRAARRPSFRTAVTLAGSVAAVLTVVTGMYVSSLGTGGTTAAPSAATAPTPRAAGTAPAGSAPEAPPPAAPPKAEFERQPEPPPGQAAEQPRPARPQERRQEQQGAAPVAEAPAGKATRYVRDVIALANAEREKTGCGPLHSENHLRTAAQGHADDMSSRDYYEHDDPEGRDAGDRMTGAGYAWSTWGENIHRGPKTPARAMEDWMDSPGHRANILNCSFKDIGVGVTLTANGPWWVQNFGARR
ncbi:CAP domain-containing protein [Streptomyces sp. CB02009]|uniref:CAP domain-containing protein n=1 Tax=Streptomyces sp. CB02009 TaxID=1703938 RepID=UPI00093F29F0|nr:CAP domain-containing protein [Streptomyces sp. CB02009]